MKGKTSFTKAEAEEIVKLIKEKLKAEPTKQKSIRAKIRNRGFWASEYGFRDGYTVEQFLSVAKIISSSVESIKSTASKNVVSPAKPSDSATKSRNQSDESYVIDLCDEVLNQEALRQHRFEYLRGDSGKTLPVDAYYPSLNLVVEFTERQHSEEVKFFDKRQTVSGVGRGEQRRLYDQRRRDVLPEHSIKLIELDYSDFEYGSRKKLVRNRENDLSVIIKKLKLMNMQIEL